MRIYGLVNDQIRVSSGGDIIGLDCGAVLKTIELYAAGDDVKELFENILMCYRTGREFSKANE